MATTPTRQDILTDELKIGVFIIGKKSPIVEFIRNIPKKIGGGLKYKSLQVKKVSSTRINIMQYTERLESDESNNESCFSLAIENRWWTWTIRVDGCVPVSWKWATRTWSCTSAARVRCAGRCARWGVTVSMPTCSASSAADAAPPDPASTPSNAGEPNCSSITSRSVRFLNGRLINSSCFLFQSAEIWDIFSSIEEKAVEHETEYQQKFKDIAQNAI